MRPHGKIKRVLVKNFRSIAKAELHLDDLTILVGPNGSGKSNTLDAIRFVADALTVTPAQAIRDRHGVRAVRRISGGHPRNWGVRIDVEFANGATGDYAFEITSTSSRDPGFRVKKEICRYKEIGQPEHILQVESGKLLLHPPGLLPPTPEDRFALTSVSAAEPFRFMYDTLTSMRFYSLVPDHIRDLQDPDSGLILHRDGSNAAATLREIKHQDDGRYERICELLNTVVSGTSNVTPKTVGPKETLEFAQDVGLENPWKFPASSASDGTLRILGILLAVHQLPSPSLVAIEEPEQTVHPAVLAPLSEVFLDRCKECPILLTTHSPELLNSEGITEKQVRIVDKFKGDTRITQMQPGDRDLINSRLSTPGELLASGELGIDQTAYDSLPDADQMPLFR